MRVKKTSNYILCAQMTKALITQMSLLDFTLSQGFLCTSFLIFTNDVSLQHFHIDLHLLVTMALKSSAERSFIN